jgi:hypothetical protein
MQVQQSSRQVFKTARVASLVMHKLHSEYRQHNFEFSHGISVTNAMNSGVSPLGQWWSILFWHVVKLNLTRDDVISNSVQLVDLCINARVCIGSGSLVRWLSVNGRCLVGGHLVVVWEVAEVAVVLGPGLDHVWAWAWSSSFSYVATRSTYTASGF